MVEKHFASRMQENVFWNDFWSGELKRIFDVWEVGLGLWLNDVT